MIKNLKLETVAYTCEICKDAISYSKMHDPKDTNENIVAYCTQCKKPTTFKLSYRNIH